MYIKGCSSVTLLYTASLIFSVPRIKLEKQRTCKNVEVHVHCESHANSLFCVYTFGVKGSELNPMHLGNQVVGVKKIQSVKSASADAKIKNCQKVESPKFYYSPIDLALSISKCKDQVTRPKVERLAAAQNDAFYIVSALIDSTESCSNKWISSALTNRAIIRLTLPNKLEFCARIAIGRFFAPLVMDQRCGAFPRKTDNPISNTIHFSPLPFLCTIQQSQVLVSALEVQKVFLAILFTKSVG